MLSTVLFASTSPVSGNDVRRSSPGATGSVDLIPATAPEILRAVRSSDGKVVLVNVWATWCMPCRKEFPELVRLSGDYAERGLKVIFVSGDFDSERAQVVEFLSAHGVSGETYQKAGKDEEFIDAFDPEWSGALPATFLYDETGARQHSILESTTYEQLEKRIVAMLGESDVAGSNPKGDDAK